MPYKDPEKKRLRARERRRQETADNQEVGLPPKRKSVARWKKACRSFKYFCETYFRDSKDPDSVFSLKWSTDHLEVIEWIEKAVRGSLQYLLVMPRGSGKSALLEIGILWAILTGQRRFGVLVAATKPKALAIIQEIKTFLLNNEKLIADFAPELYAIVKLDDEARKCKGQKCQGKKTGVQWKADRIVFPTVPGSLASGSVLSVSGMSGAIEGQKHVPVGGTKMIRPDIVLVDDPQTRASAESATQTSKRLNFINAGIKGLGGPKKGVSVLMAATIMFPNDLTSQLLDRKKYPSWRGKVYHAVRKFPKDLTPWDDYNDIRIKDGTEQAMRFYIKHRSKMDECFETYWPGRFLPEKDEISNVQHLMNLFYDDQKTFWSEYQNQPQNEGTNLFRMASREHVESLCVDDVQGMIPDATQVVVAHIDIHQNIHFGIVSAIAADGTMQKCWHGTFPDQGRVTFRQAKPPRPIPSNEDDGPMIDELSNAIRFFAQSRWRKHNGVALPTTVITIDMRWKPECTLAAMSNSGFGAMCLPYMGMPISPDQKPIKEYKVYPGDSKGDYWYLSTNNDYMVPIIKVDVNAMKERLHSKLLIDPGKVGSISLGGAPPQKMSSLDWNSMLIDHLFSKEPAFREGKKTTRVKLVFIDKPGKPDDHYFDGFVANLTMGDAYQCNPLKSPTFIQPIIQSVEADESPRVRYTAPF